MEEEFTSYYGVPLIAKGDVKGVLEIYHRSVITPGEDWLEFLNMMASQAAVAIESATLFQHFQQTNNDLTLAYDSVIESWSQALELSGRETEQHASPRRQVCNGTGRSRRGGSEGDPKPAKRRKAP